MKRVLLAGLGLSAFAFMGCGDFFNSKTTSASPGETVKSDAGGGSSRPATNPFPPGYEDPNAGAFTENKMLVNIGVNVIARSADVFSSEAAILAKRVQQACEDMNTADDAKEQWKRTMLAYHAVDSYPVGPLWANSKTLSSRLYAWPLFNPCGIDLETIKHAAGTGTAAAQLTTPLRGLGAIEYLLFEPTLGTRCNVRAYPQAVAWAQQTEEVKRADRCRLASLIAQDVAANAATLAAEWDPNGKNFSRALIDGSEPLMKSAMEATNALTDALFQFESVKDVRLGRPLGRHKDCLSETGKCPESVEHAYSGLSLRAVEARLVAFQNAFFGLFPGKDGFGFDDLLVAKGHQETANKMRAALKDAITSVRALTPAGTLQAQIEAMDPAACAATTKQDRKVEICGLFQDIREIATTFKAEVLSILALRAPPTHQGDND